MSYLRSVVLTAEQFRENMKKPKIADPCKQTPKASIVTLASVRIGATFTQRQNGEEVAYRKISHGDLCEVRRIGPGVQSKNRMWPDWTLVQI